MYAFPMTLTPDDNDTVMVTCDDLPELATFGDDEADALRHARDALTEVLADRLDRAIPIPEPSAAEGRAVVSPSLQAQIKLTIGLLMRAKGITQRDLAARMGADPKQVQRLLNLGHASRIDQIEAALDALQETNVIRLPSLGEIQATRRAVPSKRQRSRA